MSIVYVLLFLFLFFGGTQKLKKKLDSLAERAREIQEENNDVPQAIKDIFKELPQQVKRVQAQKATQTHTPAAPKKKDRAFTFQSSVETVTEEGGKGLKLTILEDEHKSSPKLDIFGGNTHKDKVEALRRGIIMKEILERRY